MNVVLYNSRYKVTALNLKKYIENYNKSKVNYFE